VTSSRFEKKSIARLVRNVVRLSTAGDLPLGNKPRFFGLDVGRVFLQIAAAGLPLADGEEPRFLAGDVADDFLQIGRLGLRRAGRLVDCFVVILYSAIGRPLSQGDRPLAFPGSHFTGRVVRPVLFVLLCNA
jgi:hypothetical protein